MPITLNIGDTSRDGLIQVTDTRWDSNGTMYVTVRELVGDHCGSWTEAQLIRKMRATARRAVPMAHLTISSTLTRRWYAESTDHATFAVSRLER